MPNRIIRESICTNDQIDALSPFEETCFYRLIVNCDDYGRCDARTSILRARLFPLKTVSHEEIENAMSALEKAGLIGRYTVEGREYLFLPGWNRNQKVRTKRMKCPPPPGWREDGAQQTDADVQQVDADVKQIDAGVKQTDADVQQVVAGVKQIDADVQQVVSDCVLNPIQSESQSESQSQSEYEGQSERGKKEKDKIYNSNWRYSPRARSATAQILVNEFHRDALPCTQIRDLFTVVERALSIGIPPDEIVLAAHSMRATEFAAHFMARDG